MPTWVETTLFGGLSKGLLAGAMTSTHAGHLFDPRQRRESRHPACGLIQALVLIEGAVPLSSTFDAQALDRTALQFEAVKRSLCFAW